MEAPPVLFHSPLYRSFIIVLGKLLYEYRPNEYRFFICPVFLWCVLLSFSVVRRSPAENPL